MGSMAKGILTFGIVGPAMLFGASALAASRGNPILAEEMAFTGGAALSSSLVMAGMVKAGQKTYGYSRGKVYFIPKKVVRRLPKTGLQKFYTNTFKKIGLIRK